MIFYYSTQIRNRFLGVFLFLLVFLFTFQTSFAQTLTVGTGTSTSSFVPIYSCYGYSYSQQLYLQSDLQATGTITNVRFYATSIPTAASTTSTGWTVYMGHTSKTEFATTTDWEPIASLTQVFSGTITYPASAPGWVDIALTTPFTYNNTSNLVIAVDENQPNWACSVTWQTTSTSPTNRSIYYRSDSVNPDPNSPPTASGRVTAFPNAQFVGLTPANPPSCIAAPTAPANAGTSFTGSLTLTWPAAVGATSYDVYLGTSSGALSLVSANQTTTSYTFTAAVGNYFWKVVPKNVNGSATGCAEWSFTVNPAPPGRTIANAIPVSSNPFTYSGNNLPANGFVSTYTGASAQSSPEIWFQFNATTCDDSITVSLCGSSFDTYLHLLDASGTEIVGNDDNGPICTGSRSSLVRRLTAPGTYYIVAEGYSSNTGTIVLDVNSFDVSAPTITCPSNTQVPVNASCQGVLPVFSAASAADNCGIPTVAQTPASGTSVSGNTTVTLTATDAGARTATCSFVVSVADATPPTIACPPAVQTVAADATCGYTLASMTALGTAADNCSGVSVAQSPAIGTRISSLGTSTVVLTATDGASLTASCSLTIQVVDNTAPVITCPAPITMASGNACSVAVIYPMATAVDNCSASTVTRTAGIVSGGLFPIGTSTVMFRATDAATNSATCALSITVMDSQAPTVVCPANRSVFTDLGSCTAVVSYNNATATDLCGSATVALISGNTSGSAFPIGTSTVVYSGTDAVGNSATCSFAVQVSDGEPTVVTCKPDVVKYTDAGQCQRSAAGVTLLQPEAYDNCGVGSMTNNAPSDVYPVGTTAVVWTVLDGGGNTNTCVQNVIIVDGDAPIITNCPEYIVVQPDTLRCELDFIDFDVQAYDFCGGISISYDEPVYSVGDHEVMVTVTDMSGNSTTCSVFVEVQGRDEVCNGIDDDCDGLIDEANDWEQHDSMEAFSSGNSSDEYGSDVAINDTLAVVGARFDDSMGTDAGAAYVYIREKDENGLYWERQIKLTPADLQAEDFFGSAVSIFNEYIAVGAPGSDEAANLGGAVYVFHRNMGGTNNWGQVAKLTASNAAMGDRFGSAVSILENWLVAGAPQADATNANAGAAYVFERNMGGANAYGEVAVLTASTADADALFGTSVALSQDGFIMVGAPQEDDSNKMEVGATYVFGQNMGGANAWGMVKRTVSPNANAYDHFGQSVDMSWDRAIVGAPLKDERGNESGLAFVFEKNRGGSNNWGQTAKLFDYQGQADDQFGYDVAIDENSAVVGARFENARGFASGAVFTFVRTTEGVWLSSEKINDKFGNQNNQFGTSVDISGRAMIFGSPFSDASRKDDIGTAAIFEDDCDGTPIHNKAANTKYDFVNANADIKAKDLTVYPTPVKSILNIAYEMPKGVAEATVQVLNSQGQLVTTVHSGVAEGFQAWTWDAAQHNSGTYFVRLITGESVQVKAVTVVK